MINVVICGGGAAGMIAAIEAASKGHSVTLIEKNEKLGKKLFITGKGRCNLTNAVDKNDFLNYIVNNPKFMMSSLNQFDSFSTIDYFQSLGVKLKTERGNRVFPESDKSSDVINVLKKRIEQLNVTVKLNERITDFILKDNIIISVVTDKATYFADKFVLATGGMSYRATGSTGDGYDFAKKLGHKIIDPAPGLVGIQCAFAYDCFNRTIPLSRLPKLEGLSLKNVKAAIINQNNKEICSDFGEMLFTNNGVSGPIILSLSSYINRLNLKELKLVIDLKPALSEEMLDTRILRDFEKTINKQFKNSLNELLPNSLIPFIINLVDINELKAVNLITREERTRVIKIIKNLSFSVYSLQELDKAIITSGGVDCREINPKTMQSKIIDNLFFSGEIIDVDALTGGFNIQIALSTGYAAGKNI